MENFDTLPTDIWVEILCRLPVESLLECKLVSKPWRYLLQDTSFSRAYLKHLDSAENSGNLSLIFENSVIEPFWYTYTEYNENSNCFSRTIRMSLKPPFQRYNIVGSYNGLICFYGWRYESAYICNPVTREYVVLQISESDEVDFLTGFGYVPSTNEYKVVRICNTRTDPRFGIVQVYTFGSGIGWKSGIKIDYDVKLTCAWGSGNLMDYDSKVDFICNRCGVFVNGAIHWVDRSGTIVAFNLADEVLEELPSPPVSLYGLYVLDGYLCVNEYHGGAFDILVLKKNQNPHGVCFWSKMFSHLLCHDCPITVTRSGGLLCCNYFDSSIYLYTPEGLSSRMLVYPGKDLVSGVPHNNTLVSLKALGEENTKLMDSVERARRGQETVIRTQRKRRKKKA